MPIQIHIDQLKEQDVHLDGEIAAEGLGLNLGAKHDLVRSAETLLYQLDALRTDDTVFVHGSLKMTFQCECARCVKPFVFNMDIPEWSCILPLEGDEAIEVIGEYVDLTPWIREDILLGLPHHPLCDESCRGLEFQQEEPTKTEADTSPTWDALEKWKQQ